MAGVMLGGSILRCSVQQLTALLSAPSKAYGLMDGLMERSKWIALNHVTGRFLTFFCSPLFLFFFFFYSPFLHARKECVVGALWMLATCQSVGIGPLVRLLQGRGNKQKADE